MKQLFEGLAQFKPQEVTVEQHARKAGLDKPGLSSLLKNLTVRGLRVYWNSLSEMFVPTSLWEQTRELKYQIFEALDAQQLIELMQ